MSRLFTMTVRAATAYRREHPEFRGSDKVAAALAYIATFRPLPEQIERLEAAWPGARSKHSAVIRYFGPRR